VRLVARSSLVLTLVIALGFASLLFVAREQLAALYSHDVEVLKVAAHLLMFGALFQIADVVQVTTISALRGFKDTRVPMYIMLFSFWGIGVPLGYTLTFSDFIVPAMGAAGFWIGLIAGLSHAAFWLVLRLFWISRAGNSTGDLQHEVHEGF
jgi:MATE family multidrug resistance protein